jgi:hypothetical protein
LIFLLRITIFLFKKTVGTCLVRVVPFRQRVRRLMVAKPIILSCNWKCYHVLFNLAWHVIVNDRRFIIDGHFFPFIYFSPWKVNVYPFYFLYFNFNPWSFYFCSWPFHSSFVCFQFKITICNVLFFLIRSLFFWFLFFFLGYFLKKFIGYQFHHSIRIYVIFFFSNLALIILMFFILLMLFFFSI